MTRSVTTVRRLAGAALSVAALDGEDTDEAVARLVADLVAGDDLLHNEVHVADAGTVVRRGTDLVHDPVLSEALGRAGTTHPAILSYLAPGDDGLPRRVSDVSTLRRWQRTPAYVEAFAATRERFQLSVVVSVGPEVGRGWTLTRTGRDFDDADVEVATLALPTLIALDALAEARRRAPPPDPRVQTLTGRERTVLDLLATGATAASIGSTLRVSEATVRKHLEHVYAKLEVNDRVTAVNRLRGR